MQAEGYGNSGVRDTPAIDYNYKDKYSDIAAEITYKNVEEYVPTYRAHVAMRCIKGWKSGKMPEATSVERKVDAVIESRKRYYPVAYQKLFDMFDEAAEAGRKDAAQFMHKNKVKYFSQQLEDMNYVLYIIELKEE